MPLKGLQLGQTKSASLVALSFFLVFLLVIASIAIFSIKAATDQANANATATAQQIATDTAANPNPYPPYRGALVLDDPLSDNTKGYQWDEYKYTPTAGYGCEFTGGAYHVIESQAYYNNCNANATTFSNFTFQVQMTIIKGDCGGIIFRANGLKLYFFELCQDGSYMLTLYVDNTGTNARTLRYASHSDSSTDLSQTNLLAVTANGSSIALYINQHLITNMSDSTYSNGQIGVFADSYNNPTEAVFSNAKVWTF